MKTNYKLFKTNATPFGGLYVVSEFLHQIKFENKFKQAFGKLRKIRRYSPSQNIEILMALIIAGGEKLFDIHRFKDDQTIKELFNLPDIPEDTSLRDDMNLIGQCKQGRDEFLLSLNELLFDKLNISSMTIDIDGTALPVDGHQEGANIGYCSVEPWSRCFQSVKAICDETETVVFEKTMSGEHHCSFEIINSIKPWLDRLSSKYDRITLRLDAGFHSGDLLTFLESYPNVNYQVCVPQPEWLQKKVRRIDYKKYHDTDRYYASFAYGNGLDGAFRYYYVERSEKDKNEQLDLFDDSKYIYRIVVSNEKRQPQVIFKSYNNRARIEKHIEELKNQYALGKMVSGSFQITEALCWLSHLTFTIMSMLRQVAFRKKLKKYRLKRLRFILINTIGYFVQHARQTIFKLGLARVGPFQFDGLMQRIWAF